MASQSCVVTEHSILHNWLARTQLLQKISKDGAGHHSSHFRCRSLSQEEQAPFPVGIVLRMPLFDIVAGGEGVPTRSRLNSSLRGIAHAELAKFNDALGTL